MTTYFISDLHLSKSNKDNFRLFSNFLSTKAQNADAIYILGDFFDAWIGDDQQSDCIQQIKINLSKLHIKKIPVYIMHGNRDFLLGKKFFSESKCQYIPDPYVINLYGRNILLTHGDLFCTNDYYYQIFRYFIRNSFIKNIFLSLPINIRVTIAKLLRSKSSKKNKKNININSNKYDVSTKTIIKYMNKYNINRIIHGHTHKPKIHTLQLAGKTAQRIVLGDWSNQAIIATYYNKPNYNKSELKLENLCLNQ